MTTPLTEYENLTAEELKWADHCFDIGDQRALAELRKLSASRAKGKNKP